MRTSERRAAAAEEQARERPRQRESVLGDCEAGWEVGRGRGGGSRGRRGGAGARARRAGGCRGPGRRGAERGAQGGNRRGESAGSRARSSHTQGRAGRAHGPLPRGGLRQHAHSPAPSTRGGCSRPGPRARHRERHRRTQSSCRRSFKGHRQPASSLLPRRSQLALTGASGEAVKRKWNPIAVTDLRS